jgi:hypothetical protein
VRIVVDKVELGWVIPEYLNLPYQFSFHHPSTYIHDNIIGVVWLSF